MEAGPRVCVMNVCIVAQERNSVDGCEYVYEFDAECKDTVRSPLSGMPDLAQCQSTETVWHLPPIPGSVCVSAKLTSLLIPPNR